MEGVAAVPDRAMRRGCANLPSFAPVCFTTPNPLRVLVTLDESGQPRSFRRAHFGVNPSCSPDLVAVELFTGPDPDVPRDPYSPLGVGLVDNVLWMRVGFSGCAPDHPLQLYASAEFEGDPATGDSLRTRAFLSHDDRDELCDAWFERLLEFDISRLVRAASGPDDGPRPFTILLELPDGTVRELHWSPPRPAP